jgi:hypothetical protein
MVETYFAFLWSLFYHLDIMFLICLGAEGYLWNILWFVVNLHNELSLLMQNILRKLK